MYKNIDKINKDKNKRRDNYEKAKRNNINSIVITIIVLLILAGVSIATLTGQNGILTQARAAKEATENTQQDEKDKLQKIYDFMSSNTYDVPKANDSTPGILAGSGSQDNPYLIESIEDLLAFSIEVNGGNDFIGQYVRLVISLDFNSNNSYMNPDTKDFGDINSNGVVENLKTELTTGKGFIPIENYNTDPIPFAGVFSGNNKFISNLYIDIQNAKGETDAGLFGYNTGTIQDIYVQNCKLNVKDYVVMLGGVCGVNDGEILRSSVSGELKAYSGGISNSANFIGGIAGICTMTGENTLIESCCNFGKILSFCDTKPVYGEIISADCNAGGITGSLQNINGYVTGCYNIGDISAETKKSCIVGGIVGFCGTGLGGSQDIPEINQKMGGNIYNSYSVGDISATENDNVTSNNLGAAIGKITRKCKNGSCICYRQL